MNEKNVETTKKIIYPEQEERVFTGNEKSTVQDEVLCHLKDAVSCLNFCDYEIHRLEKKISDKIHQLNNTKRE